MVNRGLIQLLLLVAASSTALSQVSPVSIFLNELMCGRY